MTIFYINNEKDIYGKEYFDKYDFAKFIDGNSDVPEETKKRIKKTIGQES